jgi:hypothetical protein
MDAVIAIVTHPVSVIPCSRTCCKTIAYLVMVVVHVEESIVLPILGQIGHQCLGIKFGKAYGSGGVLCHVKPFVLASFGP